MKHLCKTLAMLLLTVLVGLSGLTAYAHDVPDESKKGSVTVDFEYDNKAVTGGRLALYRIAEARQTDGNYGFENLSEFSGFHKDMSDLTSPNWPGAWRILSTATVFSLLTPGITEAAA